MPTTSAGAWRPRRSPGWPTSAASSGWTRLREGVIEGNDAGMALALAVGMREVERKPYKIAAGERELAVMELAL